MENAFFSVEISPNLTCGTQRIESNDCIYELEVFHSFSHLEWLKLKRKMRLKAMEDDPCTDVQALQCPNYLMQVVEGQTFAKDESELLLLPSVAVVQNSTELVESVFKSLEKNLLMLNG